MDNGKAQKVLNPKSVWLPVLLGFVIIAFLAYRDDQFSKESLLLFSDFRLVNILIVLLFIVFKDGLNALRVRLLSHSEIDFYPAIRVVLLWEFAIAVTPPVIGAAAVLVFIIFKEGQPFGKSLAYTLLLAILDNLFFLTASPLVILGASESVFPLVDTTNEWLEDGVSKVFWLSYSSVVAYTAFMLSALLFFPKTVRKILSSIMNLRWFQKWRAPVMKQSDEMILASQVLKGQSLLYWLKLLGLTYLIWIFKFALVNAWVGGFADLTLDNQLLMLSRHLVMWVVMLVSPSPGNAGTAELMFSVFYQDFAGKYTFVSSILWRLSTYYPYLIAGVILMPRWWKNKSASTSGQSAL